MPDTPPVIKAVRIVGWVASTIVDDDELDLLSQGPRIQSLVVAFFFFLCLFFPMRGERTRAHDSLLDI